MALVTLKSTIITNRDATPKVLTEPSISGGVMDESQGWVLTGAADNALSRYVLCQVPSGARVTSVLLQLGSGLGTSGTLDVGVWWPTFIPLGAGLNGSTASQAINSSFFASNISCSNAFGVSDILNQNGLNTVPNQEKQLWDALGLGSDPGIFLDVCAQVHVATGAAGYVGIRTRYVEGG